MSSRATGASSAADAVRRVQLTPGLAAVVLTVLLLWLAGSAAEVLLLLFLAVLVAVYLDALTGALARRTKLGRGAAFALAVILSIFAVAALAALLVPPVVAQTRQLASKLPDYIVAWSEWLKRMVERFPALGPLVGDDRQSQFVDVAIGEARAFAGALAPQLIHVVHSLINVASVLVMALYLSLHPETYRDFVVSLTPPRHRDATRDVLAALGTTLRAWTLAQLLAMAVLGALTALGLWLLGVPYWLAFGIFSGVAAIVPFFGTLVSTLLPALFVLGGAGEPGRALLVVLLGVVVHIIEGNFVAPLIFQRSVHLPPVFSIMAVLIVGKLLGPVGLLVAVPTLVVVMVFIRKVLLERVYGDTRTPEARREDAELALAASDGASAAAPVVPPRV